MKPDSLYRRLGILSPGIPRGDLEMSITETTETLDRDLEATLTDGFADQTETLETKAVETVDNDIVGELASVLDSRAALDT
jgi:hypothetical protein